MKEAVLFRQPHEAGFEIFVIATRVRVALRQAQRDTMWAVKCFVYALQFSPGYRAVFQDGFQFFLALVYLYAHGGEQPAGAQFMQPVLRGADDDAAEQVERGKMPECAG